MGCEKNVGELGQTPLALMFSGGKCVLFRNYHVLRGNNRSYVANHHPVRIFKVTVEMP